MVRGTRDSQKIFLQNLTNTTVFRAASQNLPHMRNTLVSFGNVLYSIPYFAAFGNEVVIRIDYHEPAGLLLIRELWHVSPGQSQLAVMRDARCFLRTTASPVDYGPL